MMPRLTKGMKNVGVMLDDDQLERLDEVRAHTSQTKSAVMRQALMLYHRLVCETRSGARVMIKDGESEREVWVV